MKNLVLILALAAVAFAIGQVANHSAERDEPLVVTPRAPTPPPPRLDRLSLTPPPATPLPPPASPAPSSLKAVTPASAYEPLLNPEGKPVVALDIGHTAAAPGARSATGRGEFFFNKQIVQLIASDLKRGNRVASLIINPDGAAISLPMRAQIAARRGAALFLAIHHDSAQDKYLIPWQVEGKPQFYCDDFKGYGVFVSQKNPQAARSLGFATLLGDAMGRAGFEFSPHHAEAVKGENRPIIDKFHGIYRYDDLIVLKSALMPAVFLECGVIVHREQEKLLSEPATQQRIARAAATAIEKFLAPDAPARR